MKKLEKKLKNIVIDIPEAYVVLPSFKVSFDLEINGISATGLSIEVDPGDEKSLHKVLVRIISGCNKLHENKTIIKDTILARDIIDKINGDIWSELK